jgi:hypothetical protein
MRPATTNLQIAAAALLLLLCCLSFRDLIPARDGIGYDGKYHARWVRTVSIGALYGTATAETSDEIRDALWMDSYAVRRLLPAILVRELLDAMDAEPTDRNIINAFTAANVVLLTLATFFVCRAADAIGLGTRGKWLTFLALLVSYGNLKMPLFYPVLTDTFALALGSASLWCFLAQRKILLVVIGLIGTFVWPTLAYFTFLLLVFPKREPASGLPHFARLDAAASTLAAVAAAVLAEFALRTHVVESTQVQPLHQLRYLSAMIVGVYVFLAIRPLVDVREVASSLAPRRLVREPGFWLAIALLAMSEGLVNAIAILPPRVGAGRFLMDTYYTSAAQPGVFFLAHVLYFGPVLLFLLFLWPELSRAVRKHGTGLVACFALAAAISAGSESRKLINFLPFIVLFLASAIEPRLTTRRMAVLAAVCVLVSKIWLPMDRTLEIPFAGEMSWRAIYVTSRGPWITNGAYALQLAAVALLTPLIWAWSRRTER